MAEILKVYYPRYVDLHNYVSVNRHAWKYSETLEISRCHSYSIVQKFETSKFSFNFNFIVQTTWTRHHHELDTREFILKRIVKISVHNNLIIQRRSKLNLIQKTRSYVHLHYLNSASLWTWHAWTYSETPTHYKFQFTIIYLFRDVWNVILSKKKNKKK